MCVRLSDGEYGGGDGAESERGTLQPAAFLRALRGVRPELEGLLPVQKPPVAGEEVRRAFREE